MLTVIKQSGTDFFLTGGTALSRGYYKHRYSDDLDFFVNDNKNYDVQLDLIFDGLKNAGFFWDERPGGGFVRNNGFCTLQIAWKKNDTKLKLDFVNDIPAHFGEIIQTPVFYKTDAVENILSNKISAIFRYSIKDIADIREISLHEHFEWQPIYQQACQKDAGLDLATISKIISSVPESEFDKVNWTVNPGWEQFQKDIRTIAEDMVFVRENTLCNK